MLIFINSLHFYNSKNSNENYSILFKEIKEKLSSIEKFRTIYPQCTKADEIYACLIPLEAVYFNIIFCLQT